MLKKNTYVHTDKFSLSHFEKYWNWIWILIKITRRVSQQHLTFSSLNKRIVTRYDATGVIGELFEYFKLALLSHETIIITIAF